MTARTWFGAAAAMAAIIATVCPAANARAATPEQRNAMDHIAAVLAAEKSCAGFRANLPLMVMLSNRIGLKTTHPGNRAYLAAQIRHYQNEIAQGGAEATCAQLYALYGPKGESAPNLIRMK